MKADTYEMQKARRQEHIDKVRRLQITKERLSPSKSDAKDGGLHDADFDPSNEMKCIFGSNADSSHRAANMSMTPPGKSNSEEESDTPQVTIGAIAQLFDQKLAPLHHSIGHLEEKFSNLHIHVDKEIHGLKTEVQKNYAEVSAALQMTETKISNIQNKFQEQRVKIINIENKISDTVYEDRYIE